LFLASLPEEVAGREVKRRVFSLLTSSPQKPNNERERHKQLTKYFKEDEQNQQTRCKRRRQLINYIFPSKTQNSDKEKELLVRAKIDKIASLEFISARKARTAKYILINAALMDWPYLKDELIRTAFGLC